MKHSCYMLTPKTIKNGVKKKISSNEKTPQNTALWEKPFGFVPFLLDRPKGLSLRLRLTPLF